jgi:outer membrane usher protein FimD/PapC
MSSELVDREDRSIVVGQLDRDVTFGGLVLPVHFDVSQLNRVDGARGQSYAARTSFTLAGLSTTLALRASRAAAAGEGYGPIDGVIGLLFSGKFHKVALRGEMNYRLGTSYGPVDARLTAEWSPSSRDQWQLSAGYSWQSRAASASFGYSHSFDRFSVTSSFNGASTGDVSARVNLLFSLGSDARGHFGRVSADRLASSGSVAVNIYRDENGDGRRGRDEPIEREAQIRVANQPIRNAIAGDGPILVGGLTPAAMVSVAIDPSSLNDPLLDPSQKAIRIVPRRGLTVHLDLAVTASGLIEGNLAGAKELVAADVAVGLFGIDGKEIARTTTDYDGSFLFEKVRYGRYRVVIGPSEAGSVQSLDVNVDANNPVVHLRNMGPSKAPPVSAM